MCERLERPWLLWKHWWLRSWTLHHRLHLHRPRGFLRLQLPSRQDWSVKITTWPKKLLLHTWSLQSWAQMTLAPNLNNIDSFYSEIMHLYCNDFSYYNIKPSQIRSSNSSDSLYFQGLLCHIDDPAPVTHARWELNVTRTPSMAGSTVTAPQGMGGGHVPMILTSVSTVRQFVCLSFCVSVFLFIYPCTYISVLGISYLAWNFLSHFFGTSGQNPCEHGGLCKNTKGSFTCNCALGYTGLLCETSINVTPTSARIMPTR